MKLTEILKLFQRIETEYELVKKKFKRNIKVVNNRWLLFKIKDEFLQQVRQ